MLQRLLYGLSRQKRVDRLARPLQSGVHKLFSASPGAKRFKDLLNGTWLGHPLHPALTDVPIGAWTVAVAVDLLDRRGTRAGRFASSVALTTGLAGAGLSALAGIADWSDVNRRQRPVGLVHALLNVAAVGAFGSSLAMRLRGNYSAGKALAAGGYAFAAAGAYLGGHLVYTLGTQVDRNAWAGEADEFTAVMEESDLPERVLTRATFRGEPVLLYREGARIFALADTCSHAGCSLANGRVENGVLICPCHGSSYRLADGSVVHGPSPYPQPSFESRVRDGQIELRSAPLGRRRRAFAEAAAPAGAGYRAPSEPAPVQP
ncbi:MAG: Rieske 2Fe-2S domain-containing protein [Myxococcales bacterium]|jgi:nitrite reductase/ring-hydroxylating ferredoxin subunit/uncharacterized membrane protein